MRFVLPAAAVALFAGTCFAQIPMSKFNNTYTSNRVRGYHFQAPVDFTITAVQVPDESNKGKQYVAIYKMTSAPPPYSQSRMEKAVFYKGDVPSGQKIPVIPPVSYKKGDWVGVLGCCATSATSTSCSNSYGAANFPSRIAGTPVTLIRFITQTVIGTNQGNCPVSASTGSTSRIITWVANQGSTEHYGTGNTGLFRSDPNPPSIGHTCELDIMPKDANNKGAIFLMGAQRVAIKTAFGSLYVLPIVATIPIAGPIPKTGTAIKLPIPNNTAFLKAKIPTQVALITSTLSLDLSNGAELNIDK